MNRKSKLNRIFNNMKSEGLITDDNLDNDYCIYDEHNQIIDFGMIIIKACEFYFEVIHGHSTWTDDPQKDYSRQYNEDIAYYIKNYPTFVKLIGCNDCFGCGDW